MYSGKLLWRLGCKLHALGIKISKFDFFFKIIIIIYELFYYIQADWLTKIT